MPVDGEPSAASAYVLGHSNDELERLGRQAKLVDPMTRRFFRQAGIGPGMRVLDIGSGAGHVAFLLAELVGPSGEVVGTDRSPVPLATARARARSNSIGQVSFLEGDPARMTFERPFDAVVGRYILMFQPDPVVMLRGVARHVRPGGVIVFHECDWGGARTFPSVPLYERCCTWIVEAVTRSGADCRMGIKLHSAFAAAGLPPPGLALEALIGGGSDLERIRFITEIVGTLRESIVSLGIASESELGIETLAERIAADAAAKGAVLASRSEIAAWSRMP